MSQDLECSPVMRTLLDLVTARVPVSWRNRSVPLDVPLGSDGIGLDSIAIVELLLDCEAVLAIPFPPEIFDAGPLTLRRLVAHADRHRPPRES
jgi:acyl carrier protein